MEHAALVSDEIEDGGPALIVAEASVDATDWLARNCDRLETSLQRCGAILLRGFGIDSVQEFEKARRALIRTPLEYVYRSTPRTLLGASVYSATEYPAHQSIPLHNENAYQRSWPMLMLFCCVQAPERGGETPLASVRAVTRQIDPDVRGTFAARKVMYVRNYAPGVDLPWQVVFQTDDPRQVEQYCRTKDIQYEWRHGGGLRTQQVCEALARHPRTGETLWFNQAHLFHPSALDQATRRALVSLYGVEDLPRNACYGDGGGIEEDVLDHIRQAYAGHARTFAWQRGDLLLLDNMLCAHGRNPYSGPRSVLVSMGEPSA